MATYTPPKEQRRTSSAFEYCRLNREGSLCNPDGTRWVYKYCVPAKKGAIINKTQSKGDE